MGSEMCIRDRSSSESSTESSTSESSSSETSTSETTDSGKEPRKRGETGGPDDSLEKKYANAMPKKLQDLVHDCKSGSFKLKRENNREVPGMQCQGVWDSPWDFNKIDLMHDVKYAPKEIKYLKDHSATVWSDDPNNFAGYVMDDMKPLIFIVNQAEGVVLECEMLFEEESTLEEVLTALGYEKP